MFEQTVDGQLICLIERLRDGVSDLKDFYLAGGTALALHLGHRLSVDLDFFSENEFNVVHLTKEVLEIPNSAAVKSERRTLKVAVGNSSVSFFHYPYVLLEKCTIWKGIRLASSEDILCMKMIAISQRAEKKDFFDLLELLKHFTPEQIKELLIKKYGKEKLNCYHLLRSAFFFDDAESSPDPISLNKTTWKQVKAGLKKIETNISKEFIRC